MQEPKTCGECEWFTENENDIFNDKKLAHIGKCEICDELTHREYKPPRKCIAEWWWL